MWRPPASFGGWGAFEGRRCLGLAWLGNARGRPPPWPFLQQLTHCPDTSCGDKDDGATCLGLLRVHVRGTYNSDTDPFRGPEGPGYMRAQMLWGEPVDRALSSTGHWRTPEGGQVTGGGRGERGNLSPAEANMCLLSAQRMMKAGGTGSWLRVCVPGNTCVLGGRAQCVPGGLCVDSAVVLAAPGPT